MRVWQLNSFNKSRKRFYLKLRGICDSYDLCRVHNSLQEMGSLEVMPSLEAVSRQQFQCLGFGLCLGDHCFQVSWPWSSLSWSWSWGSLSWSHHCSWLVLCIPLTYQTKTTIIISICCLWTTETCCKQYSNRSILLTEQFVLLLQTPDGKITRGFLNAFSAYSMSLGWLMPPGLGGDDTWPSLGLGRSPSSQRFISTWNCS
jgi:hypothetical protein